MQYVRLLTGVVFLCTGIIAGIAIERHWLGSNATSLPESETALEHAHKHVAPDNVCTMHADVVSKEPGSCPVCGMDLVARQVTTKQPESGGRSEVVVTPEFIHNFGVRTASVERGPVARRIVALGRVARMPQPQLTKVAPGFSGKIVLVTDKAISVRVDQGERLYVVDSPEWRELQQSYLEAIAEEDTERSGQLKQQLQSLKQESLIWRYSRLKPLLS